MEMERKSYNKIEIFQAGASKEARGCPQSSGKEKPQLGWKAACSDMTQENIQSLVYPRESGDGVGRGQIT